MELTRLLVALMGNCLMHADPREDIALTCELSPMLSGVDSTTGTHVLRIQLQDVKDRNDYDLERVGLTEIVQDARRMPIPQSPLGGARNSNVRRLEGKEPKGRNVINQYAMVNLKGKAFVDDGRADSMYRVDMRLPLDDL